MPNSSTHIFRVSLRAKLYREIEIASAKSLSDLAQGIVAAFGFNFDHAFGFYSKLTGHYSDSPVKFELFADLEHGRSDAGSVERTKIAKAFPTVGAKMLFLFDYGDEWHFQVELRALGEKVPKERYPRIVAWVGAAPEQYPDFEEE